MGPGLFTIPHGPVRSGVMESIEYLVETPGEDIAHLNMRVFYKHRGIEKRFEQLPAADGVLLAERTEGVASVAHALAYCHAMERLAGVSVPWPAGLVRVLHAELERLAAHLDSAVRLADAAGLAVATARFGAAQGTDRPAGQPDVREQVRPRRGGARRGAGAARSSPAPSSAPRSGGWSGRSPLMRGS